ncbi:DUF881 domain-containing protein [Blastococcus sp. SYSU D00922]
MTAPPRGGGPRSMGASLLDAVLAETLDPAYAQAAAARSAGAPRRRRWGRAAVAVTMVVAGLLVAVTYDQAAATVQGRDQVRAALIDDIHSASAVSDDLAAQLEALRTEVTSTRDDLLAASAVGQRARDALARAEQGAGAVPVTGPGLLVTLANADPSADEDPVGGGTTEEDPREQVQDGDLQLVVNALWAAGAEAISINGQRLGPTTAIRFAGEAVLVDFRPVTNPYEISAIGDPDTLVSEFLASPEVGALAVISQTFGLRFDYAEQEELSVPAASVPELRSAVPEDGDDPDPGPDTDPDTTPDPTAGG